MAFALLVCSALHNPTVSLFLLLFFSRTLLHIVYLFHSAVSHNDLLLFPPNPVSCIVHHAAEGTIFCSTGYKWDSIWCKPICIIPLPLWEFSLGHFVIPRHATWVASREPCVSGSQSAAGSYFLFFSSSLSRERKKSIREACSMSHPSPQGTSFGDSANCKGGHCVVGLSLHKTKELALRLSLYCFLTQGRALLSVSHSVCLSLSLFLPSSRSLWPDGGWWA